MRSHEMNKIQNMQSSVFFHLRISHWIHFNLTESFGNHTTVSRWVSCCRHSLISCAHCYYVRIKLRRKSIFSSRWQMTITVDFYLEKDVSTQNRRFERESRSWTFQVHYQRGKKKRHKVLFRSSEEAFVVFCYFVFFFPLNWWFCHCYSRVTRNVLKFCSLAIIKVTLQLKTSQKLKYQLHIDMCQYATSVRWTSFV